MLWSAIVLERRESFRLFCEMWTGTVLRSASSRHYRGTVRPITLWTNRDEAWAVVARGIRNVIDELRASRAGA